MADPTKYTKGYSFEGYQANSPSKPLPAPRLDDELENVATSIDETIDALKDIRRSDGKLKNGIVTVEALESSVSALIAAVPGLAAAAAASAAAAATSATNASGSVAAATAQAAAAAASAVAAAGSAAYAAAVAAGIVKLPFVTLEMFGGKMFDGGPVFDNTAAFSLALSTGLPVYLGAGVYYVTQVQLPTRAVIVGHRGKSRIKAIAGSNKSLIVLGVNTVERLHLANFIVDGNKSEQSAGSWHGVHLAGNSSSSAMSSASDMAKNDPTHLVENLLIVDTRGDGYRVEGRGEIVSRGIFTYRVDGVGIYHSAFDSWLSDCSAGASGLHGVHIPAGGANIRLSNIKSWFSGQIDPANGNAFHFEADYTQASNLEAQDPKGHAFVIKGRCGAFASLRAESAGQDGVAGASDKVGLLLDGARYNSIVGFAAYDRDTTQAMAYAVRFSNDADNNQVIGTAERMLTGIVDGSTRYNYVVINGITYGRVSQNGDDAKEAYFDFSSGAAGGLGLKIRRADHAALPGVHDFYFGGAPGVGAFRIQHFDGASTYKTVAEARPSEFFQPQSRQIPLKTDAGYYFTDANGRLRFKYGHVAPTSDTDGRSVNLNSVLTLMADADELFSVTTGNEYRAETIMTANRFKTISGAGSVDGDILSFTHVAAGGFTINLQSVKTLSANQWCQLIRISGAWKLHRYGTL